jgi:hypothetical protein
MSLGHMTPAEYDELLRRQGIEAWEREQVNQRVVNDAKATWEAAAAARPWHQRGWSAVDLSAPPLAEQQYQQQQAANDRQVRWVQYATEKNARGAFRADGTPVTYDLRTPPDWFK